VAEQMSGRHRAAGAATVLMLLKVHLNKIEDMRKYCIRQEVSRKLFSFIFFTGGEPGVQPVGGAGA
jgi:hypothetical protein